MEDFYYAGGLPALLRVLAPQLDSSCLTITGKRSGKILPAPKFTIRKSSALWIPPFLHPAGWPFCTVISHPTEQ